MVATAAPPAAPPRPSRPVAARRGLLVDALLAISLFLVASAVFLHAAETVPFHGDESEWIGAGRYFKFIFLDHDVSSSVWRPSWLNRDQPPIGRYVIGSITWATGTNPSQLNRTYD